MEHHTSEQVFHRLEKGDRYVISHDSPIIMGGVPANTELIFTAPQVIGSIGCNALGTSLARGSTVRCEGEYADLSAAGSVGRGSKLIVPKGILRIAGHIREGAVVEHAGEISYKSASDQAKIIVRPTFEPPTNPDPDHRPRGPYYDPESPQVVTDIINTLGFIPKNLAEGIFSDIFRKEDE